MTISSGLVPRELFPGIVWDDNAESRFVECATVLLRKANQKIDGWEASSLREARWMVETDLHRRFIKARVIEADSCSSDNAKKLLVRRWKEMYGVERSDRLVRIVRHGELKKTVLMDW